MLSMLSEDIDDNGQKINIPLPGYGTRRTWWFIWKLLNDRLPVKQKLHNWNSEIDDTCTLCNNEVESLEHLFLFCDSAKILWSSINDWANLSIRPNSLSALLTLFTKGGKNNHWLPLKRIITSYGLWHI